MDWTTGKEGSTRVLARGTELHIHRHVDFAKDAWLLSGTGWLSGFNRVLLKNKDLNDAQQEVDRRVKDILTGLTKAFEG